MVKIFPISSYSIAPPLYASRDRVTRAGHLVSINAPARVLIFKVMGSCSDIGLYIWLYSIRRAILFTQMEAPLHGESLCAAPVRPPIINYLFPVLVSLWNLCGRAVIIIII